MKPSDLMGTKRQSWDWVAEFYEDLIPRPGGGEHLRPVLNLVLALRKTDLANRLRAGQSMSTLPISNAERHGLRPGDRYVAVDTGRDGSIAISYKRLVNRFETCESARATSKPDDLQQVVLELLDRLERDSEVS